jgi:hypothetical protein
MLKMQHYMLNALIMVIDRNCRAAKRSGLFTNAIFWPVSRVHRSARLAELVIGPRDNWDLAIR